MKGILGIATFMIAPIAGVYIVNVLYPGALGWKEALGLLSFPLLMAIFMTPQELLIGKAKED